MKNWNWILFAGVMAAVSGCGRGSHPVAQNAADTTSAPARPAAAVAKVTFSDLPIPPKPVVTPEFIAQGRQVYEQNCAACHGARGDAKADAAAFLLPKPRNFVEAKYRLRSTPPGNLPTDTDLYRAVSLGLAGTPMPPWQFHLSETDRWAVVEFIKTFSPRFADPTEDRKSGGALGDGPSVPTLVDDSGAHIKPRDFSRPGGFKSGYATKEIARAILTGFDGTPMVGFNGAITTDDAWKLAYFVETLAKPTPTVVARASQNFLVRESLGVPDVPIRVKERTWHYAPEIIRVKRGQVVEIPFEPTDNGLGVGHGFAVSSYDEAVFINGVMVGAPRTVTFRADPAGRFTTYCPTQCSTDKLHPLMNGTLVVEDDAPRKTASLQ